MNKPRRSHRFQHKILFFSLAFLALFVLFSTLYWSVRLYSEQKNSQTINLRVLAQQGNDAVNQLITDRSEILYMHNNPDIREILERPEEPGGTQLAQDKAHLQYLLKGIMQIDRFLAAVEYVGQNGAKYSDGGESLADLAGYDGLLAAAETRNGAPHIGTPFHDVLGGERRYLLPIAKKLINIETGTPMGYVTLYLDFWSFCENLDQNTQAAEGNYTALYSDEELLYNSTTSLPSPGPNSSRAELSGFVAELQKGGVYSDSARLEGEDILLAGVQNPQSGWYIVKYTRDELPPQNLLGSILPFLGASLLCLLLLSVAAYSMSARMTQNIDRLHRRICETSSDHLVEAELPRPANDEIGDLTLAFNDMVRNLNQSIEQEYLAKISEKDMRLRALNYQINPHFLYNSLNVISSIAKLHDVPDIGTVTRNLGEMFRYSLEDSDYVPIRRELAYMEHYLAIQGIRYPGLFRVFFAVDDEVLDCKCPKFILQPIVENCFSHGMNMGRPRERTHAIDVAVEERGDGVCISVLDNGHGILPARLQQLREQLHGEGPEGCIPESSIGLWNVNKRMESHFGSRYGLSISSVEGLFTLVEIKLPRIMEKEAADEHPGGG